MWLLVTDVNGEYRAENRMQTHTGVKGGDDTGDVSLCYGKALHHRMAMMAHMKNRITIR